MKTRHFFRLVSALKMALALFAVSVVVHLVPLANAQVPDTLQYNLPAPIGFLQSNARLGGSVAIDGKYAVAGAADDGFVAESAGAVKVFDTATGALRFTLTAPYAADLADFGKAVAISGTRVAVGDPGGRKIYVYDLARTTPNTPATILNSPGGGSELFGFGVAMSGTRLVAWLGGGNHVYVYDLAGSNPTQPAVTLSKPGPGMSQFGKSVAISGTLVVVGIPDDDAMGRGAGSVYVYDIASATPQTPVAILHRPNAGIGDGFGNTVAISGTRIVVGMKYHSVFAPSVESAYVFDLASATPSVPVATLAKPGAPWSGSFDTPVAIAGTRVAVGVPKDGLAYLYDLASATSTAAVATLNDPSPGGTPAFGSALAISGMQVVVGDPEDDTGQVNAGSAFLYDMSSPSPTVPVATLNSPSPSRQDFFGEALAVSGTRMVVVAPGRKVAYLYDLSSATPTVPASMLTIPNESYGVFRHSVAISGTHVVIGNGDDSTDGARSGRAFVYDLAGPNPTQPALTIRNPEPVTDATFGISVAIADTHVVIGAPAADAWGMPTGRAYVFDLASPTPAAPVVTLDEPTPASYAQFGWAVAISGTRIVVAAPNSGTNVPGGGSVYAYDLAGAAPSVPIATLHKSNAVGNEHIGASVAISGSRIAIGMPNVGTVGAVAIYDLAGASPTLPVVTLAPTYTSLAPVSGFGGAVAISGTRLVVGAPSSSSAGVFHVGVAYVYDLSSPTATTPVAVLKNPRQAYGYFGDAVAIDETTVAIGTPYDSFAAGAKGVAYVFEPGPFARWKHDILGNDFAAETGDTDHDGVIHLLEYTLGLDPGVPDRETLPQGMAFDYADGRRLRMFVPRDPAHGDVTVEVQAAGDVEGPWTTVASSTLGHPFTGSGYVGGDSDTPGVKTVEVRDVVSVSSAGRRFMRVRVTH